MLISSLNGPSLARTIVTSGPMARRDALALLALWIGATVLAGCTVGGLQGPTLATTTPAGAPEYIPIQIQKPDGAGPFPAVVIMHDCSGLGPRSSGAPGRWATELVGAGLRRHHARQLHDARLSRRRLHRSLAEPRRRRPVARVRDAYAALAYLRTLPFVDGSRVGLMGGSHGGSTTLAAMVAPESERAARAGQARRFRRAVALYPGCAARLGAGAPSTGVYRPVAPLLILIGEKDDWTPAEPCRKLTDAAQAGYPVTIKVYPGAYHSFDSDQPGALRGDARQRECARRAWRHHRRRSRSLGRQHSRGRRVLWPVSCGSRGRSHAPEHGRRERRRSARRSP